MNAARTPPASLVFRGPEAVDVDRSARIDRDRDGAVGVGSQHPGAGALEPLDRGTGRVAVRVAGAGRHDRDPRADGVEEGRRRGRRAAVVGDLQDVDRRQAAAREQRIDVVLDVAGQQEPPAGDLAEQDDRDVVDAAARVGRLARHATRVRPQDAKPDPVEADRRPGREERVAAARRVAGGSRANAA